MLAIDNDAVKRQLEQFLGSLRTKSACLVTVLVFAAVGSYILSISNAATSAVNVETESGARGGSVSVLTNANGSGGNGTTPTSARQYPAGNGPRAGQIVFGN